MSELPGYEAALARVLEDVDVCPDEETVPLDAALGRTLREVIYADRNLPPFDRAQMDGYAVRGAELGHIDAFPVVATIPAGAPADVRVPPGTCVAIATGAPLPADVDTVVQHERSDRANPVHLDATGFAPGHAVHPRGADARAGAPVVLSGTRLGPHHLGLAATVGRETVVVTRTIRATVLTSGDEVVDVGAAVAPYQIRNSNGIQTLALLRRVGGVDGVHRHVRDDRDATIAQVRDALDRSDLVITNGGVSAGDRDHFPAAFEAAGVTPLVHKAAIQPGKPILVGRDPRGRIVVALPGNPVSSLACFCLFVWPIVGRLTAGCGALPWRSIVLDAPVRPNPRRQAFRPARLVSGDRALVPQWAGSGDLAHTTMTDGLVALPVQPDEVPAGAVVSFLPWP